MRPFVSIVVPIYNVELYLERCVSSLLNQTLSNIEIILVDDQSPDKCPFICDMLAKKDGRIKVVHKSNGGLGFARNSGIDVATGEYVAFIDSDDYIELNMMEVLYSKATELKVDAVISGGFISEFSNGVVSVSKDIDEESIVSSDVYNIALKMMGAPPRYKNDYYYEMSACKGIYSLDLLREKTVRFHSERELISEDLKFHFDFCRVAKRILLLPGCFYHYCENMESLTKAYNPLRFLRNVDFYEYMIQDFAHESYAVQGRLYADRMLLARARVAIGQIERNFEGKYGVEVRTSIANICQNETLHSVLADYPIDELPIKQRIFVLLLKYRVNYGLFLLAYLNNRKKK